MHNFIIVVCHLEYADWTAFLKWGLWSILVACICTTYFKASLLMHMKFGYDFTHSHVKVLTAVWKQGDIFFLLTLLFFSTFSAVDFFFFFFHTIASKSSKSSVEEKQIWCLSHRWYPLTSMVLQPSGTNYEKRRWCLLLYTSTSKEL